MPISKGPSAFGLGMTAFVCRRYTARMKEETYRRPATGQQLKLIVQARRELIGRQHVHPCRGQLERERNSVESAADVDDRRRGVSIQRERLIARARPIDRFADSERHDRRDEVERCGHCGRARRTEWRFCAFCGQRWPTCDRCDTPLPELVGVRFCPGCGVMLDTDKHQ